MKAVIMAGGYGTRISEETNDKPKPMVELCGTPIIIHLMRYLSSQGIEEFIICLGYRSFVIKNYFLTYFAQNSDFRIDTRNSLNSIEYIKEPTDKWSVTLIDTGLDTQIGGRLKRVMQFVRNDEFFLMTYGDGLSNILVSELVSHHKKMGCLATVTGVTPPGRFGAIKHFDNMVSNFTEKPDGDNALINGGFFILSPEVDKYISDDDTVWEREPLENLASDGQLSVYVHTGFWQAMDTLRDRKKLENLIINGDAPWIINS